MKDNKQIMNKLKSKIQLKDYTSSIEILKKEIKKIYISKINEVDKMYKYTNMLNLIEKTEQLLSDKYVKNIKKLYILVNEENNQIYECDCLLNIYKSIL